MADAPTIIHVDDSADDRALVCRELLKVWPAVNLITISTFDQFAAELRNGPPDLVITDFALQWADGLQVLREVKSRYPDCPVVMFTGSGNQEVAVEAMKEGLEDYVVKSQRNYFRVAASAQLVLRRRAADRRASRLEMRQQALMNRLRVGVFRMTLDGDLVECNPAFLRLVGAATLDDAKRQDLSPLRLPADQRERLLALPTDGGHSAEWGAAFNPPGGPPLWLAISATLTRVEDRLYVDAIVDDQTDRRRMLEELRAANAAKDQFISVLSHELRTPLSPVLSVVSLWELGGRFPPELREDLTMLRRNIEHEVRLVDELLDISRIARNKLRLNPTLLDAHTAVQSAWEEAQAAGPAARTITTEFHLDASDPLVWADPSRIRQVLANLFGNALKFTPDGGSIHVTTRNAPAAQGPGGEFLCDISDTGAGIAPEVLPRIFEPFEQGDPAVRAAQGGLGLGLSIARRLAQLHGGTLQAASAGRGLGATFTLCLPLATAEQRTLKTTPDAREAARRARSLSVLLVEDHLDTARSFTKLLNALSHRVHVAHSLEAAVAAFAEQSFDLIISDIGLPDGSGLDLPRRLAAEGNEVLRAIAVSGYGTEEDRRRSQMAGFAEHLVKPIDISQLQTVIDRVAAF